MHNLKTGNNVIENIKEWTLIYTMQRRALPLNMFSIKQHHYTESNNGWNEKPLKYIGDSVMASKDSF